jgi:hypothetical protein
LRTFQNKFLRSILEVMKLKHVGLI